MWSKDDKYGFISNTGCPVHGKATKKMLKRTIPFKSKKPKPKKKYFTADWFGKKRKPKGCGKMFYIIEEVGKRKSGHNCVCGRNKWGYLCPSCRKFVAKEKTYNEVTHDVLEGELTKRAEETCKDCGYPKEDHFKEDKEICPTSQVRKFVAKERKKPWDDVKRINKELGETRGFATTKPKNLLKEIAEKTGADEVKITDEPSGKVIAEYKKPKNHRDKEMEGMLDRAFEEMKKRGYRVLSPKEHKELVKGKKIIFSKQVIKDMKQLKEDLEFYEHARNYKEDTFTTLSEGRKKLFKLICEKFAFYKFSDMKLSAEQWTGQVLDLIEEQDKEFIKNIKRPIKAELKFAEKHDTQLARVVKLFLNQILKNIEKEAGEEIVGMKVTESQLIMEMVKGYMKQIRNIVTFEDVKIMGDIVKKEQELSK